MKSTTSHTLLVPMRVPFSYLPTATNSDIPWQGVPGPLFEQGNQRDSDTAGRYQRKPANENLLAMGERECSINGARPEDIGPCQPLAWFKDEPSCPEGCLECERTYRQNAISVENIEWARIVYLMRAEAGV